MREIESKKEKQGKEGKDEGKKHIGCGKKRRKKTGRRKK